MNSVKILTLVVASVVGLGHLSTAEGAILASSPNIDLTVALDKNVTFPGGATIIDPQAVLDSAPTVPSGNTTLNGPNFQLVVNTGAGQGIVQGNAPNLYSAPFDASNTQITDRYLSTGTGTITFIFSNPQAFLGLLWGSVDGSNRVQFFSGNTLVGTVLGTDVTANANGSQSASNSFFVAANLVNGVTFDSVVLSSDVVSFESSNVFAADQNSTSTVPEPATFALLGAGLAGFAFFRRRQA